MKKLLLILVILMSFNFTPKDLEQIRDHPHLIGHLVGKDKLTEMHSTWIKDVWLHNKPLQAHRGSYKTTAITEIGSVWWLLFNPDHRIGIFRKPYTEAANTLFTIRTFFEMEPIQALFYYAHKKLYKFKKRKENVLLFDFKRSVTKEGSVNAYGISDVRTGTHLDKAICDDIITLKDRLSRAERENTIQGVLELITNIMDPDQEVGFVGTPWHKEDAWTIVEKIKEIMKFDVFQTGILTQEQINDKKDKTTAPLFACNYLLRHESSEDAEFKDPNYDRWDWHCTDRQAHIDAKYSGDHYGALTIMGLRKEDKGLQAIGWTFEENVKEKIDWILERCYKYRVKTLHMEENADKGFLADALKKAQTAKLNEGVIRSDQVIKIKTYHEKMNKHIKIVTYLKEVWREMIWAHETEDLYMEFIVDYREKQQPDDPPDSAASLVREGYHKKVGGMDLWQM